MYLILWGICEIYYYVHPWRSLSWHLNRKIIEQCEPANWKFLISDSWEALKWNKYRWMRYNFGDKINKMPAEMTDGSHSTLLTFFPLQSQYFIRNVGVFQYNTQNGRHRAPLCALFLSEITFFVYGHCVSPFHSTIYPFNIYTMSGLLVGWNFLVFFFSINFFFRSKCHFWLFHCYIYPNTKLTNEQSHVYAYHTPHWMAPFCIDFLHLFRFFFSLLQL